eukprot:Plantae.Rhodophyta-Hildenbrandia_rubra.ctg8132.p1 GENE.Plantae.Rhodophyta-Hildenbrandia_rubra.ctg8132~~Plantae.Rhodophyta-Hildenbrandia_rubra.ctg8132.p1  ORF type:complete len:422 (+),score=95.79 Plantae.Rhodophyta-Hildenbrandia_rubra.ctg8132:172-1437(+)
MDSNTNPNTQAPNPEAQEPPETTEAPTTTTTSTEEPAQNGPQESSEDFFKPYQATALESLGDLFPGVAKKRLEDALEAHGGSVERAANYLLIDTGDNGEVGSGSGDGAGEQVDAGNVAETDEEMARRLYQEEGGGVGGASGGDGGNTAGSAGGATLESDEMLARQLAGLDVGGGRVVGESDDWRAAVALQRELDGESRAFMHQETDEMVRFVRDGLAEGVRLEVVERGLLDAQGIRDGVEWGVSGVELVGFSLPDSGVHVTRIGSSVKVAVRDVLMDVRIARWQYRRDGLIPISDSGKAWVVVSGVSASLRIGQGGLVGSSLGKVEGAVKMKTKDSAVDWLYNAIGVMTKGILGGWIAEVVGDALKRAVLERVQLWEVNHQPNNVGANTEEQAIDTPPSTNPDAERNSLNQTPRPLANEGI